MSSNPLGDANKIRILDKPSLTSAVDGTQMGPMPCQEPDGLLNRLRSAGDPLHLIAADALTANSAEIQRLRARIQILEWVARLNGETVRNLQRASIEAAAQTFQYEQ